jgi:hypothetical protein
MTSGLLSGTPAGLLAIGAAAAVIPTFDIRPPAIPNAANAIPKANIVVRSLFIATSTWSAFWRIISAKISVLLFR